jgi:hypothetical protein
VCVPPYPCPSIFLKKFVSVFGKWHHHFETLPLKQVGWWWVQNLGPSFCHTHTYLGRTSFVLFYGGGGVSSWHLVPWIVAPRYTKICPTCSSLESGSCLSSSIHQKPSLTLNPNPSHLSSLFTFIGCSEQKSNGE